LTADTQEILFLIFHGAGLCHECSPLMAQDDLLQGKRLSGLRGQE
jgi:hypothetical protein